MFGDVPPAASIRLSSPRDLDAKGTHARCRPTSATATFSTQCDTPSCRRAGQGLLAMTPPHDSRGRHFIRRTAAAACHLPLKARRAAGQLSATASTRRRQPLNGEPTSILIAALQQSFLMVMRMFLSSSPACICAGWSSPDRAACRRPVSMLWVAHQRTHNGGKRTHCLTRIAHSPCGMWATLQIARHGDASLHR